MRFREKNTFSPNSFPGTVFPLFPKQQLAPWALVSFLRSELFPGALPPSPPCPAAPQPSCPPGLPSACLPRAPSVSQMTFSLPNSVFFRLASAHPLSINLKMAPHRKSSHRGRWLFTHAPNSWTMTSQALHAIALWLQFSCSVQRLFLFYYCIPEPSTMCTHDRCSIIFDGNKRERR